MKLVDAAIELSKRGFHVFPVKANSKTPPLIKDFKTKASSDEKEIKKFWQEHSDANIGIAGSKFQDDKRLIIVDIDVSGDKKGLENFQALKREGKKFPETFTQKTASGGMHLVYCTDKKLKQGANVLAQGIDIRSEGGYIVGAGSRVNDGGYSIAHEAPVCRAPEWIELMCAPDTIDDAPKNELKIDSSMSVSTAIRYLKSAPIAKEGGGGDEQTYKVAAQLRDYGVSADMALTLMSENWNDRCEPPWELLALKVKVDNAYKHGQNPEGSKSPEGIFEKKEDVKNPEYWEIINRNHAVMVNEKTPTILVDTVDEDGKPDLKFISRASLLTKFENWPVWGESDNGRKKKIPASQAWLQNPQRREINKIVFAPGRKLSDRYFNLWKGFTTEPIPYKKASDDAKRGFDLWLEHVHLNIAAGDKNLATWFICYLAHIIQRPAERVQTCVVFRGLKGTGKNAPLDRFGALLGPHYDVVAHNRYITGNFNSHLESKLVMVFNEAFWAGDKSADGIIKDMVNSPTIKIERKYAEAYNTTNLARLFIVSNEFKVVNATADERRYTVFKIADHWKQNVKLFTEMRIKCDKMGGNAVLLDYLSKYDFKQKDIDIAPMTAGLLEQKQFNMNPVEQWWFDCLFEGRIVTNDYHQEGWPETIRLKSILDKLNSDLKQKGVRNYDWSPMTLSTELRKFVPVWRDKVERGADSVQYRAKQIGDLDSCRDAWDKHMGFNHDWS